MDFDDRCSEVSPSLVPQCLVLTAVCELAVGDAEPRVNGWSVIDSDRRNAEPTVGVQHTQFKKHNVVPYYSQR